ncbi:MAG: hypothetical protein HC933_11425 [Pleurocapsa sp. SU_196_0]|nr:hypothetical protein [Pleurocapsa sp. SU_196_0]
MNLHHLFGELSRRDAQRALAQRFPFAHFKDGEGGGEGGGGGSDDEDRAFNERRYKELEGMTVESLRNQVVRLENDNKAQRGQIRTLEETIKTGSAEKVELETYRAHGKPDELKSKLERAAKDADAVLGFRRLEVVGKVAAISKLNPERLAEIVKLKGLELEIGEGIVEKDGKPEKPEKGEVAFVKGADGKPVPLADYVKTDLASFSSWLGDTGEGKPASGPGTNVVPQPGAGGGGKGGDWLDELVSTVSAKNTPAFDPFSTKQPAAPPIGGKTT